jgi:hypothetical protein
VRCSLRVALFTVAAVIAVPVWAQTATELKKELLPKIKKAQAEGRDLGEAAIEYKAGDEALKQGLSEEALEHLQKAKAAMPADAK